MNELFQSSCVEAWHSLLDPADASLLDRTGQRLVPAIEQLPALLCGMNRLLFVIDRIAVKASGLGEAIDLAVASVDQVTCFDGFSPNPTSEQAAEAAHAASSLNADGVLAVGGGSCMDIAKVAALSARRPESIQTLSRGEIIEGLDVLPLIAVPTTSGTGSDATHFAAIYVDGRKVSIAHTDMRPRAVVLDARFHMAMPPRLAAATGFDALGQAMESLWAVGRTALSARYAKAGGRLVADHLVSSVGRGSIEQRMAVMIGAHLAGQAINISKTTAAHAMSYGLTQRFGLAHGHAVALSLGMLGQLNADVTGQNCQDPAGPAVVRRHVEQAAAILGVAPGGLPDAMGDLLEACGLEPSVAALGIDVNACRGLAEQVDLVRLSNNPRRLSAEALASMLTGPQLES